MKNYGPLVAAIAAIAAAPAHAGSLDKAAIEARRVMRDYAACVVHTEHLSASAAILGDANNWDILRKYPELISSACLGHATGDDVQMKFGGDFYRYALADALVNSDFASGGSTSFADRLPLAHLLLPSAAELDAKMATTKSKRLRSELQDSLAKDALVTRLSRYGECVVRDDPEGSRYWLLTKPDVPEEMSRINALRPAFADCLTDGTVRFPIAMLRGTIAINYYRLAMATRQPPIEVKH